MGPKAANDGERHMKCDIKFWMSRERGVLLLIYGRLPLMLFWSGPLGASCSAPCSLSHPQAPAGRWRWGSEGVQEANESLWSPHCRLASRSSARLGGIPRRATPPHSLGANIKTTPRESEAKEPRPSSPVAEVGKLLTRERLDPRTYFPVLARSLEPGYWLIVVEAVMVLA